MGEDSMPQVANTGSLSRDEARSLTDEVRGDAERLWRKLVELYEGRAHVALGYGSWGAYFKAEFGGSQSKAYRLLDAGRVVGELESHSPIGESRLPNEGQARALAPLKSDPEMLREVWTEVIDTYEKPTAADVREVVQQKVGPTSRRAEINTAASKRKLGETLASLAGYREGIERFIRVDEALSVATPHDLKEWRDIAVTMARTLSALARQIKEAQDRAA